MAMHGEYRLRTLDAAAYEEEKRKHADWFRDPDPVKVHQAMDEIVDALQVTDSGWLDNIVTDFARRYLIAGGIGGAMRLFLHQNTNPSNVRLSTLQNTYTDGAASQVQAVIVSATLDDSLLLQTRITQFPQPTVPRTVNLVGMTPLTDISVAQWSLNSIISYTKLTSTVVQQPTEVANLQHRLTWSLG